MFKNNNVGLCYKTHMSTSNDTITAECINTLILFQNIYRENNKRKTDLGELIMN